MADKLAYEEVDFTLTFLIAPHRYDITTENFLVTQEVVTMSIFIEDKVVAMTIIQFQCFKSFMKLLQTFQLMGWNAVYFVGFTN